MCQLKDQKARAQIIEQGKKPNGQPYRIGVIDLPSFYADMKAEPGSDAKSATDSKDQSPCCAAKTTSQTKASCCSTADKSKTACSGGACKDAPSKRVLLSPKAAGEARS